MRKVDFLKKLGFAALFVPIAAARNPQKADAAGDNAVLDGLWEATVAGGGTTYRYIYSISRGAYVATGDVDENFMNFKFSPTMGAYTRDPDGSYRYRERGYVFDLKGKNVGTFTSAGTFELGPDRNTLRGPGTFTQYDLHGKAIATEKFSMTATRHAI